MHRLLIPILLVSLALSTRAQAPSEQFERANALYTEGNFQDAANAYQQLLDSGFYSVELLYNLGNAYFRLGQIPHAILNFERAHLLDPSDEDILFNLELSRTLTTDRIEVLPEFPLKSWFRSARGVLSPNGWAWLSIALIVLSLSLVLVFWFSRRSRVKRLSFAAIILLAIFVALSILFSAQERNRLITRSSAIIFAPVVAVRSSPGESGKEIFILHAGTKVTVSKSLTDWAEIRIADGNKGWVPSSALEIIQIW